MDKNICAFLDETAYTIEVEFNPNRSNGKRYHYVTNLPNIAVGDLVIVPVGEYVVMQLAIEDNIRESYQYGIARDAVATTFQLNETLIPHSGLNQNNLKVVKVIKVDADANIPPNNNYEILWVVAKLDLTYIQGLLARNKETTKLVEEAYKQRVRRGFKEQMLGELGSAEVARIQQLMGGGDK